MVWEAAGIANTHQDEKKEIKVLFLALPYQYKFVIIYNENDAKIDGFLLHLFCQSNCFNCIGNGLHLVHLQLFILLKQELLLILAFSPLTP